MKTEFRIDAELGLSIPKQTAEFCLKVVENYCRDTGTKIEVTYHNDGTLSYDFIPRREQNENRDD